MKDRERQIDRVFKKRLENFEDTPNSNVWDQIESKLPAKQSQKFYWVAASVVAILLSATILWNIILQQAGNLEYETYTSEVRAHFPQQEFIPLPILIHTNTIVYIKQEESNITDTIEEIRAEPEVIGTDVNSVLELQPLSTSLTLSSEISTISPTNRFIDNNSDPVMIIYKKGDPKYPKFTKALNFIKEVGDGDRQLINLDKISNNLIARRETSNNSNN